MKDAAIKYGIPVAGAGIGFFLGRKIGKAKGKGTMGAIIGTLVLGGLAYYGSTKLATTVVADPANVKK